MVCATQGQIANQFRRERGAHSGAHGRDARFGNILPRDKAIDAQATPQQLADILSLLRHGLDEGALGVGMGIAYVPGATRDEIFRVFQLAAARGMTVFVHLRSSGPVDPGGIDALQEVLADAAASGASLHVVHITSTELRETPLALEMIHSAAQHNLDVTTEAYPYTEGMTDIGSAIFSEGWQQETAESRTTICNGRKQASG